MASYTVATAKHATLAGGTADSVAFSRSFRAIEVKNRDTALDIYFRLDGTTPVAAADNNYIVVAGESLIIADDWTNETVKLISSGAAKYSITGVGLR